MGRDGDAARPELIFRARGLSARFGDRVALERFDLDVAPGEIVGLLGPNGAGKSTALRLIVRQAVRRRTGVAGDEPVHLDALTGWENALGFAMASGLARLDAARRVEALFETFGLTADAHRPVSAYSHGMRRKLLLAEALAHLPSLIVLDEPTSGLDPDARAVLVDVLRHRAGAGAAVVIATHDLPTASAACDRVLFLRSGRTVLEGRPDELITRLGGSTRYEFAIVSTRPPAVSLPGVEIALTTPARLIAYAANGTSVLPALCDAIQREGAAIESVQVRRPDLGDVFLKATGQELER